MSVVETASVQRFLVHVHDQKLRRPIQAKTTSASIDGQVYFTYESSHEIKSAEKTSQREDV